MNQLLSMLQTKQLIRVTQAVTQDTAWHLTDVQLTNLGWVEREQTYITSTKQWRRKVNALISYQAGMYTKHAYSTPYSKQS